MRNGGILNKKKLDNAELKTSIDTLSIISPELSIQTKETASYINNARIMQNLSHDITHCQYVINPNKAGKGELYGYSEYSEVMEYILSDMNISQYYRNRVDFRIDSRQDNYNELLKLNKCVILLLSLRYKVKNRYQSFDPLTFDNLTIRIQNQYFEAENYNKAIEEPNGDIKNRLELRSKSISHNKPIPVLAQEWVNKLDATIECYQELQDRCNIELLKRWNIEKHNQVKTMSEFIRKYQGNIFCRKQLTAFLEAIGIDNPVKAADNFKHRNHVEYFSLNDIKAYHKKIVSSFDEFLLN